jgi:hypothetical protein
MFLARLGMRVGAAARGRNQAFVTTLMSACHGRCHPSIPTRSVVLGGDAMSAGKDFLSAKFT